MTAGAPPEVRLWFPAERQANLRDFWAVYLRHYDELRAVTLRVVEQHETLAPLLRVMSPEQIAADDAHSRELMRRGLEDGEWQPYELNLRMHGVIYARMGLRFSTWFDIITAFRADLMRYLVETYGAEPSRLIGAMVVLGDLLDRSMTTVAESYMQTSDDLVRAAEARHTGILNAALDPVVSTNGRGIVTEFNRTAERTFGYASVDAVGQRFADLLIPARVREAYAAGLAGCFAPGDDPAVGKRVELTAQRSDGSELPIEAAVVGMRAPDGEFSYTGHLRDLTAQKRADQSLALWSNMFDQAHFGVVVWSGEEGAVVSANPAYERMLGYGSGGLIGRTAHELVAPDSHERVPELRMALESNGHQTEEIDLLHRNGTPVPALVTSSVLPRWLGEQHLTITTVVDLRERRALERERERSAELVECSRRTEQANRLKSEFLANMSHELRTPLNSILGFAELLHDGRVGPLAAKQVEFLAHILRSGRHLLQLINDVLDLAKVEAGKMEFHPEPLLVEAVCVEVVATLAALADSKRITIAVDVSPALGLVELDAGRLKQVLYNLVSNALKFTPDGGRVVVRGAAEGEEELRLEVEDTGIGIAAEQLGMLFSDFEQLDAGSAKGHPGTGLGLALTRKLAAAQGGRVGVRSALGRGSTFHVILPRRRPGAPAGPPGESQEVQHGR